MVSSRRAVSSVPAGEAGKDFMSPYIRPIVFLRSRTCYLENAKCASSSIIDLLGDADSLASNAGRHEARLAILRSRDTIDGRTIPPGIRWRLLQALSEFRTVTCVRNPYVRLLSAYLDLVENPRRFPLQRIEAFGTASQVSFAEFVCKVENQRTQEMNFHWRPQVALLAPETIRYDCVARMERFPQDLGKLALSASTRMGARGQEHGTRASALVDEYYTEDLRTRIYDRYRADFDVFGYYPELARIMDFKGHRSHTSIGTRPANVQQPLPVWSPAFLFARMFNFVQRSAVWTFAWYARRAVARARSRFIR